MLIAIEGIDGSGKGTQTKALATRLSGDGHRVATFAFPQYDTNRFGAAVARYLNGEFGQLDAVPPHFAALLYAGDRFETRDRLTDALGGHDVVIADRYIASNLVYQGARVAEEERPDFMGWISEIEFEVYQLPRPDIQILLDVPPAVGADLVGRKGERSYTDAKADLHEANAEFMTQCHTVYEALAEAQAVGPWVRIACVNDDGVLRPVEEITTEIFDAVASRLRAAKEPDTVED